ncbi:hypothetical protein LTA6_000949 [Microbacterium sp. LTA6]
MTITTDDFAEAFSPVRRLFADYIAGETGYSARARLARDCAITAERAV